MKAMNQTLGLILGLLMLIALWLAVTALPVRAGAQCGPYAVVVERLADRWHEAPRGRGLAGGSEYVVMLFHDAEGKTWTVLGVTADGIACILATGTAWEVIEPAPTGTEG